MAPPTALDAFTKVVDRGFPGIHGLYTGTNYEWFLLVCLGDKITYKTFFGDVVEKKGKFAGRCYIQYYDTFFYNQKSDLVAKAQHHIMRLERGETKRGDKYSEIHQQKYSKSDIESIYSDYDKEIIRGSNTLYWGDVQIGEELTPVVKGPLTVTDIIAWNIAVGGVYIKAHKHMVNYLKKHQALTVPNELGIPDIPERVHWDQEFAKTIGAPGPYDYGPERIAWIGHMMTNWISDDGFLRKLNVQLRRLNLIGDTTWCKGKVLRKYVEDNENLVECEVWCENQRKERTAVGTATVRLPLKD